jgi:hypothetical protein
MHFLSAAAHAKIVLEADYRVGETACLFPAKVLSLMAGTAVVHTDVRNEPLPTRPLKPFPAAFELLVSCCCVDRSQLAVSAPESWGTHEWKAFLALVDQHRLLPQVCAAVQSNRLPVTVQQKLRSRSMDHLRSSLWFTSEMLRVLAHLEDRGISSIPYKGPGLAQVLYGDATQRQFGDLDFLVRDSDVFRARAALKELGYECEQKFSSRQERAYLSSHYELTFSSPQTHNLIELQWRPVPRFYAMDFDVAGFFERAQTVEIGGVPVRTLSPEDLLLMLCVHAAKHAWNQLSLLADIAALLKRNEIAWDKCEAVMRQLRIRRIVMVNLQLAHQLFQVELPTPMAAYLDEVSRNIAEARAQSLVNDDTLDPVSPSYFRLMLSLREDWRDRARFLWRLCFTSGTGEWSEVTLPPAMFLLYPVVRLLRLTRRLLASTSRLTRKPA